MKNSTFLPTFCEVTKEEMDTYLSGLDESEPAPYHIYCMIDQVFHHADADYRGGLSFFQRINNKLGKYEQHTLDMLEVFVNDDKDYMHMLQALFTEEDMSIYGI